MGTIKRPAPDLNFPRSILDDDKVAGFVPAQKTHSVGELSEQEWQVVISQCGLMYGWVINKETNTIVRASRPGTAVLPAQWKDRFVTLPS
jgi:hypothetical protein